MKVDLRHQNIVELYFDNEGLNDDERAVARAVRSLDASNNKIRLINGLQLLFHNLSEVRLSHNDLGRQCAARSQIAALNSKPCCCDGLPPWIAALPRTTRLLDISYNFIPSFVQCSCNAIDSLTQVTTDATEGLLRRLRHAAPNAISLFFSSVQFPHLETLILHHNSFMTNVETCRSEEEEWYSLLDTVAASDTPIVLTAALKEMDLSFCSALSSINGFLFSSPSLSVQKVRVEECAISDFFGISALSHYAPHVEDITLRCCPIEKSILQSDMPVLQELLETVLKSLTEEGCPSDFEKQISAVIRELCYEHVATLGAYISELIEDTKGHDGSHLPSCLYAALVSLVVPGVVTIDETLSVARCKNALLHGFYKTVENVLCKKTEKNALVDFCSLAGRWDPTGKQRWVQVPLGGGNDAERPCPNPTPPCDEEMTATKRRLLLKAEMLEEAVKRSKNAQREMEGEIARWQKELAANRLRIKEQRATITLLRSRRDTLKEEMDLLKERIRKRRMEVGYGAKAIRSKQLKKSAPVAKPLETVSTVQQSGSLTRNLEPEKSRSEVLRRAAAQKKIKEFEITHPFSFTPNRFRKEEPFQYAPNNAPFGTDFSMVEQQSNARAPEKYKNPTSIAAVESSPQKSQLRDVMDHCAAEVTAESVDALSLAALIESASVTHKKQLKLREIQMGFRKKLIVENTDETVPITSSSPYSGSLHTSSGTRSPSKVPRFIEWNNFMFPPENKNSSAELTSFFSVHVSILQSFSSSQPSHSQLPEMSTDRKAVVKNADMPEDMQADAIEVALQAMEKFNVEKDIAAYVKKEFDKKYQPTWHCIVGRNFGSYITHETHCFLYFYFGQVAILLFKSGKIGFRMIKLPSLFYIFFLSTRTLVPSSRSGEIDYFQFVMLEWRSIQQQKKKIR
eukprot:gene13385-9212_t